MRSFRTRRGDAGVTLIELMVVIAISAILLAVGVPAMTNFLDRNRVAGEVNEFLTDFAWAVNRGRGSERAVFCRSTNGAKADAICDKADKNWDSGWIGFVDTKIEKEVPPFQRDTVDPAENLVIGYARSATQVTITASEDVNGIYVIGGTVWLLDGKPLSSVSPDPYPLRLDFAGAENSNRRSVCISATGRAHTAAAFGACP